MAACINIRLPSMTTLAIMPTRTPPKNNSEIIWFRISDSDVERVAEKCVLEAEASLLFYEKLEDVE